MLPGMQLVPFVHPSVQNLIRDLVPVPFTGILLSPSVPSLGETWGYLAHLVGAYKVSPGLNFGVLEVHTE